MSTGFDTNLPSIRQIQSFIKSQQRVEMKLLTGEALSGHIRWQDPDCMALVDDSNRQTLIWRQAIAYVTALDA